MDNITAAGKITSPKLYVLKAIIEHKENAYKTFGELNAKHVDDIAQLLHDYAIEVADNIITRVAKGEIKIKVRK